MSCERSVNQDGGAMRIRNIFGNGTHIDHLPVPSTPVYTKNQIIIAELKAFEEKCRNSDQLKPQTGSKGGA